MSKFYIRMNLLGNLGVTVRRCQRDPKESCRFCRKMDLSCKKLADFTYKEHGREGAKEAAADYVKTINPGGHSLREKQKPPAI